MARLVIAAALLPHQRHRAQGVHPHPTRPAHAHRRAHRAHLAAAAVLLRDQLRREERPDRGARPGQDRREPRVPSDVPVVGLLRGEGRHRQPRRSRRRVPAQPRADRGRGAARIRARARSRREGAGRRHGRRHRAQRRAAGPGVRHRAQPARTATRCSSSGPTGRASTPRSSAGSNRVCEPGTTPSASRPTS